MHTFVGPHGTRFHHNGDFSGFVSIAKEGERLVDIPAQDLLALAAAYVRMNRITALESASADELLLGRADA